MYFLLFNHGLEEVVVLIKPDLSAICSSPIIRFFMVYRRLNGCLDVQLLGLRGNSGSSIWRGKSASGAGSDLGRDGGDGGGGASWEGIPFFQWVVKPPVPSEVDLIGDCTAEITSASVASYNSPEDVFNVGYVYFLILSVAKVPSDRSIAKKLNSWEQRIRNGHLDLRYSSSLFGRSPTLEQRRVSVRTINLPTVVWWHSHEVRALPTYA